MDILAATVVEKQNVSHKSKSGNYAPAVFGRRAHAERGGYGRADFELAMQELLRAGRIEIVEYGRPSNLLEKLVATVGGAGRHGSGTVP